MIKDASLQPDVFEIIRHKKTESPYSGAYELIEAKGTYLCRACGVALFRSQSKFNAGCGWPSFDAGLINVIEKPDSDGRRTEICCAACTAHLGHVFDGEGFTSTLRRFCVNSSSLDFVDDPDIVETEEAIVAGGCFWGIQYYFNQLKGVLKTEAGYTGGRLSQPSYYTVCTGNTGHFEAVRVLYNPAQLNFNALIRYFFEIHDPTQSNGQGLDRGPQYQSAVFYYTPQQKEVVEKIMRLLTSKGLTLVTHLLKVSTFWPAEISHQNYYEKNQQKPYCHVYTKRFEE